MKRTFLLLICILIQISSSFSQSAKKYVLIEHFTNSWCSICKSLNPSLYNLLDNYPGDYHHISYHPPIPYVGCIFYQHNMSENSTRTAYYNIPGTPRIMMQGTYLGLGNPLLPQSVLENELGKTSPLRIKVEEEQVGTNKEVTITIKTFSPISGQFKAYAAIAEKEIDYNSPNGETLHHDVFRRMLPNIEGNPFTPAPVGFSVTLNYNFTLDPEWDSTEVYVVAFVQDTITKEIINSGTKYDIIMDATISDEACTGALNGAIDLDVSGGIPPYQYQWSNGETSRDIQGLAAGVFSVTISDANSTTITDSLVVNQSNNLSTNTSYTPSTANDGTATVTVTGGLPPYAYNWSNGDMTQTAINLAPAVYYVTVTDFNNCTITDSVTVAQIALSGQVTHVSCFNGSDAGIEITVLGGTGPYDFTWSHGATTKDVDNLMAGKYTVTVEDASNNMIIQFFDISQPDSLSVVVNSTPENGMKMDGMVSLIVTGGTPPYQYEWSNGATGETENNLSAAEYAITVSDANSCSKVVMVKVSSIPTTSIETQHVGHAMHLYPNPTSNSIQLEIQTESFENPFVILYSSLGKVVMKKSVNKAIKNFVINVANQPPGIYYLQLQDGSYSATKRVVKF